MILLDRGSHWERMSDVLSAVPVDDGKMQKKPLSPLTSLPKRPPNKINNHEKRVILLFFPPFFFSVHWKQMTTSPVCFGASADSFGRFVTPIAGDLLSFKLIHQSGSVECAAGWSSRWGCTLPSVSKDHRLGTIITNSQSVRLLPKDDYFFVEGSPCNNHYYGLSGQAADSPELLFDNFSTPLNVSIGEEFRIWFTEDFYKCGYADNGLGKTCVLVFGLFV